MRFEFNQDSEMGLFYWHTYTSMTYGPDSMTSFENIKNLMTILLKVTDVKKDKLKLFVRPIIYND